MDKVIDDAVEEVIPGEVEEEVLITKAVKRQVKYKQIGNLTNNVEATLVSRNFFFSRSPRTIGLLAFTLLPIVLDLLPTLRLELLDLGLVVDPSESDELCLRARESDSDAEGYRSNGVSGNGELS